MSQSARKGSDENIRHVTKAEVEALFHDGSDEEGNPGLSVWDIPPFRDDSDNSNKAPVTKPSTNKTLNKIFKSANRESIMKQINKTKKIPIANTNAKPNSKVDKKPATKPVKNSSTKNATTPSDGASGDSITRIAEGSTIDPIQAPAVKSNNKPAEEAHVERGINSVSKTTQKIVKKTTDQVVKKSAKEAPRGLSIKNKMKPRKEATKQDTNTVSDKLTIDESNKRFSESCKNSHDIRILRQTGGYHGLDNGRLSAVHETHAPGVPLNTEPYFTPPEPSRELAHKQKQNLNKRRHSSGDGKEVEKTKKRRLSLLRAIENGDLPDASTISP